MSDQLNIEGAQSLSSILWPDARLESIMIDYDTVTLAVRDSMGSHKRLCCHGYIGFQWLSVWDETIIESATLLPHDELKD